VCVRARAPACVRAFCTVVMLAETIFFFLCAVFISHIHILKRRRPRPTQGCRANDDNDDDILKKVMNCETRLRHFTLCCLASMKYCVEKECFNHIQSSKYVTPGGDEKIQIQFFGGGTCW
jgi:hypothetical protein